MSLLCRLGLHRWRYSDMAQTFVAFFPESGERLRFGLRCRSLRYDDGAGGWRVGVRGVLRVAEAAKTEKP